VLLVTVPLTGTQTSRRDGGCRRRSTSVAELAHQAHSSTGYFGDGNPEQGTATVFGPTRVRCYAPDFDSEMIFSLGNLSSTPYAIIRTAWIKLMRPAS
jgi:hypothetical protein